MRPWFLFALLGACSSTTIINNVIATDGGDAAPVVQVDAGTEAAAIDAGADAETEAADALVCATSSLVTGGTSKQVEPIGTGQPTFCNPACGVPAYGYVVGSGIPPIAGCYQISGAGDFCCPTIACVRDTRHDTHCASLPNGHIYNWACAESPGIPGNPAAMPPSNCVGSQESAPSGVVYLCCDSP